MRHRPTRNRTLDEAAWFAGAPWDRRLEAYMPEASSPARLGAWVSSIWRRTEGAPTLREKHADAVSMILVWQERAERRDAHAFDAHLAAVKLANKYAGAAEQWAKGRAA